MDSSSIPEGYTFLNKDLFVSVKAKEMILDLLDQAEKRDPDLFDMYVYNDFYPYAILDLFHKTLSSLHTKVCKRDYSAAWPIAEALTHFLNIASDFSQCDDGELVRMTNKAYGSLIVGLIRGLKKEDLLDSAHFSSLECFLAAVTELWEFMNGQGCESAYGVVCKAVGKRLFKDKSEEQKALEIAWVQEWQNSRNVDKPEDDEEQQEEEEDEDEEDKGGNKPWFRGGKEAEEDLKDRDFSRERVWKEYRGYLNETPNFPLRGPPCWDISEWTEEEKRPFLLSNYA
ncbi:hypothetical protein K435DRAFT_7585 [Dendrothele bispora CBS 962.96]|uniref:Uncharacterized protein n=1 Tax=Dendrothele bispora (strain CBS 962.96) TaxID=1314807 RepID=A0A4S8N0E3_DENBC|nr:hypothetical protein K435DRAFT_7585 [Dendrothele bispora CBS 962.96]